MTRLLQHGPSAQAEQRPEAVALVFHGETVTYGALEQESNRLARLLREAGCRRGDRVALMAPKSPAAIAAMLGILKADCVYVPVDPANPASRAGRILSKVGARWVLAGGEAERPLEELLSAEGFKGAVRVGWLEDRPPPATSFAPVFTRRDLRACSGEPRSYENSSQDAAHILFTSGSTGEPKGVIITHANVLHFLDWAIEYFGLTRSDRNSGFTPLHFDLSTFDIYGSLSAGAQLHLVGPELNLLPQKLAEFIRGAELTQWFSVPSALKYMAKFDVVRVGDFPGLRRVLWCGEVLPTPVLVYWMKRLPHVTFTNLYGPTEATIASSYYTLPGYPGDDSQPIPIGRACPGEELLVLDDNLQPLPPGEAGGLFIRGVGLSPGYWGDPEKTAAVFLENPRSVAPGDRIYRTGDLARVGEDGLVYFLGRADAQIKSRGYRIELGEIESALHRMPVLREVAVVGVPTDGFEGTAIGCAYVVSPGSEVTPASLRRRLSADLPAYMLPSRWMPMEGLPHNANGKIDRRKLRALFEEGADHQGRG